MQFLVVSYFAVIHELMAMFYVFVVKETNACSKFDQLHLTRNSLHKSVKRSWKSCLGVY